MLNTITDFMFDNAYMIINIIVVCQIALLAIGLAETAQNEVEELIEFYEEKAE